MDHEESKEAIQCAKCRRANDSDAAFCQNCGRPLAGSAAGSRRRPYLYALLLLPVLFAAAAIGYYKFYLPDGVVAVVNGETISRAELDAAVKAGGHGANVPEERLGRVRYEALADLIDQRIACQEARKAGITVPPAELEEEIERLRTASGLDEEAFLGAMAEEYGSVKAFRKSVERRLAAGKFIEQRVIAGVSSPSLADSRLRDWMERELQRASVRIALAEELPGPPCGCGTTSAGMPKDHCASRPTAHQAKP